jgi:hypothetical protein
MIFRVPILRAIERGEVTLAFRRWVRPAVRPGGTLRTAVGVVRFGEVTRLADRQIPEGDARAAGYASAADLLADLDTRDDGDIYRIEVEHAGDDPRIALREDADLTDDAWAQLSKSLGRLDAASTTGPWTAGVLRLIADRPAVRAADLARRLGQERDAFKLNVRKLKNLGLTESLEVGYRLSPRGVRVLARLGQAPRFGAM